MFMPKLCYKLDPVWFVFHVFFSANISSIYIKSLTFSFCIFFKPVLHVSDKPSCEEIFVGIPISFDKQNK